MGLSLQETNSLTFALLWGSRGLLWGTPTDTKNEVDWCRNGAWESGSSPSRGLLPLSPQKSSVP